MEGLLGVTRAAEYLGVTRQRVYKMIEDGVLVPVRVDGKPFFTIQDLDKRNEKMGKSKEDVNSDRPTIDKSK